MRRLALGVDLGGTNVRAAAVDAGTGEIVAAHKEPLRDRAPERVVDVVRQALGKAAAAAGIRVRNSRRIMLGALSRRGKVGAP